MKKLLIATAVAATLFAPQAFAQAKNFEGFSVAANINLTNSTAEYINSVSGNSSNLDVRAEYAFALGDKFVLGLGASAALSDYKIASNANMKNTTSLFITPGYAVSNTMLVYGKVGAIQGSFAVDPTPTVDMSGTAFGIGIKNFINKNVFIQGEFLSNNYDDKKSAANITAKSKATFFSFGVGYQF